MARRSSCTLALLCLALLGGALADIASGSSHATPRHTPLQTARVQAAPPPPPAALTPPLHPCTSSEYGVCPSYIVVAGDTLLTIASRLGTTAGQPATSRWLHASAVFPMPPALRPVHTSALISSWA